MQTVRSQLFEGITNEECARMFQCFGAREAGYEAGALISEFDGEQNAVGVLGLILLLGALAAPLLRTVVTMFLYRAASALLQPIGDSPLARGMGDYAEVFSLLFIIQLSVGAMFLLLVAQLLTVANLTVMLR